MPATAETLARLRVLQVIPTTRFGGLERVATQLTLELDARIEQVVVATRGGHPFENLLREGGIAVEPIPQLKPEPRPLLAGTRALATLLRRHRPHVVHAHNPTAAAAAGLARLLAGARSTAIVTTYHGVDETRSRTAARTMATFSDVVVAVGPTVARELRSLGVAPRDAATILNAVVADVCRDAADVRREFGATDAELVVTVGRLAKEKNQRLLLDALAVLRDRRPALRALLVGAGPLEQELRARTDELGLAGVVTLTGSRGDAVDLAAAADVFVLPSDREAMPVALLEAMAVGTPVVSTDVRGIRDVVRDGDSGLLVPPRDAAALAAAIERVLDDSRLPAHLTAHARAFVAARCTIDGMVDRYCAVYVDALERRRRPSARRAGASPSK